MQSICQSIYIKLITTVSSTIFVDGHIVRPWRSSSWDSWVPPFLEHAHHFELFYIMLLCGLLEYYLVFRINGVSNPQKDWPTIRPPQLKTVNSSIIFFRIFSGIPVFVWPMGLQHSKVLSTLPFPQLKADHHPTPPSHTHTHTHTTWDSTDPSIIFFLIFSSLFKYTSVCLTHGASTLKRVIHLQQLKALLSPVNGSVVIFCFCCSILLLYWYPIVKV